MKEIVYNKDGTTKEIEIPDIPVDNREETLMQIQELKTQFDIEYARKEQKYRRLYTLKLKCDDGSDPYENLVKLYNEAEIKRSRIQELEKLLNG